MGDPVTAGLMTAANAGLKIAGNLSDGIAKKTAAQIDALKMETAAKAAKVRGIQVDADFRERLNDAQQTIDVMRASMNTSLDSPTAMALHKEAERRNDSARITAVSNERMRALGYEGDATALQLSAKQHTQNALLKSIPEVIDGAQSLYKAGKGLF